MTVEKHVDHAALAREAGRLANSKIASIQCRYTGQNNAASARARAELAQLHKINGSNNDSWFATDGLILEGWSRERMEQFGASESDEGRVFCALKKTLGLYALHQQSKPIGCAILRNKDESDEDFRARAARASFGRACRLIEPELDEAACVRRRLMAIERANDFDAVLYNVRSLIRLMKSSKNDQLIRLDYWALAKDLYLLQLPGGWQENVISRWSRDYFTFVETHE